MPLLPQDGHVVAIAAQDASFKLDPRRQAPLVEQPSLGNDGISQFYGALFKSTKVNPVGAQQPASVVAQTIAQISRGTLDQHAEVVIAQRADSATACDPKRYARLT